MLLIQSSIYRKSTTLNLKGLAFVFCIFLSLVCCKEASVSIKDDYITIEITHPSGSDFSYSLVDKKHFFAPYPFNVGVYRKDDVQTEFMVLSQNVSEGTDLNVIPLAKMSLREANTDQIKDIYIAIPKEDDLALIQDLDFSKLTVEHFSLKQIVEFWYSNRYGLQGTSVKGWAPADLEDFK